MDEVVVVHHVPASSPLPRPRLAQALVHPVGIGREECSARIGVGGLEGQESAGGRGVFGVVREGEDGADAGAGAEAVVRGGR